MPSFKIELSGIGEWDGRFVSIDTLNQWPPDEYSIPVYDGPSGSYQAGEPATGDTAQVVPDRTITFRMSHHVSQGNYFVYRQMESA